MVYLLLGVAVILFFVVSSFLISRKRRGLHTPVSKEVKIHTPLQNSCEPTKSSYTDEIATISKDSKLNNCHDQNSIITDDCKVKEYKEEIKALKDEICEKDIDISDCQRKLELKEENIKNLNVYIEEERKKKTKLQEENETLKVSLEEKEKKISSQNDILKVLQNLLSDSNQYDSKVDEEKGNIKNVKDFVSGPFLKLHESLFKSNIIGSNIEEYKDDKIRYIASLRNWITHSEKKWLTGKPTVAFVGEFSSGKTSIVNRILSQNGITTPYLPVSSKVTTKIPTYIIGGDKTAYHFTSEKIWMKEISKETFTNLSSEEFDRIAGISSLIKYYTITCSSSILQKINILDTPGFNSKDEVCEKKTIEILNDCDVVFWVVDINTGMINKSSLIKLKENIKVPIYIILSKLDTKGEIDIKKVEDVVKNSLLENNVAVQGIFRYSPEAIENATNESISKTHYDRQNFIDEIKNELEKFKGTIDSKIRLCDDNYKITYQEYIESKERINASIRGLQTKCDIISHIPQWVGHLFGKDKYEMSYTEGNRLKDMLSRIANDDIKVISKQIEQLTEKESNLQDKQAELRQLKSAQTEINDACEQYKIITYKFV